MLFDVRTSAPYKTRIKVPNIPVLLNWFKRKWPTLTSGRRQRNENAIILARYALYDLILLDLARLIVIQQLLRAKVSPRNIE